MSMDEQLPEGWVETTIGSIAEVNPSVDTFSLPESTLVSFVPMAAVEANTGQMDSSQIRKLGEVRKGYTAFQENDILFAKITPCMENGKFAVAQSLASGIGFGSTEFHILRTEKDVNFQLLYYYLSQELFRQLARTAMTGSAGQLRVPAMFLADAPYPLAPANEQARIVAAIEQKFSNLDAGIASLQSAKAKIPQYRASLLKAAVEGELTAEWREEQPVEESGEQLLGRILAERRTRWEEEQLAKMREKGKVPLHDEWKKEYREPQGPDVESLPELPEGWCWTTVENLLVESPCNGISIKGSDIPPGFPALKLSAMSDSGFDYDARRYILISDSIAESLTIQKGDFFVSRGNGSIHLVGRGTLAQTPPERIVFPDTMIRLRFMNISQLSRYIAYVWSSNFVRKQIEAKARTTAGIYKISQSDIKSFVLPLPPLAEQVQIIAEVEAQLSEIAKMEEAIGHSLKRAEHERQSILREAFAGRLVEQDTADEPASVLLERIREERRRREEVENGRSKGERRMQMRKRKVSRTDRERIYYTLQGAERALKPEELFTQAGFKVDEQPESVEAFQVELTPLEHAGAIREERPDYNTVVLRAVELPEEKMLELFGTMEDGQEDETEEGSAVEVGEDERGKDVEQARLWDL